MPSSCVIPSVPVTPVPSVYWKRYQVLMDPAATPAVPAVATAPHPPPERLTQFVIFVPVLLVLRVPFTVSLTPERLSIMLMLSVVGAKEKVPVTVPAAAQFAKKLPTLVDVRG